MIFTSPPLLLLLLAVSPALANARGSIVTTRREQKKRQCQPITIPMCKDIGYNLTFMPNEFNHETQEEAGLEVSLLRPFLRAQTWPNSRAIAAAGSVRAIPCN